MISALVVFLVGKFVDKLNFFWMMLPVALAGGFWFTAAAIASRVFKPEDQEFMNDGPAALLVAGFFLVLVLEIALHRRVLNLLLKK